MYLSSFHACAPGEEGRRAEIRPPWWHFEGWEALGPATSPQPTGIPDTAGVSDVSSGNLADC